MTSVFPELSKPRAALAVAELLVMQGLSYFGGSQITTLALFIDAIILAVVIAPPIYWLVLNPIHREYEKRLKAESEAEEMSRVAITDPLTHIMNRRGITVGLLDAMAHSAAYLAQGDSSRFLSHVASAMREISSESLSMFRLCSADTCTTRSNPKA